ncbi:MAG: hypothetical protein CMN76_20785 [Spirochaetaceae bacterium]|nr:hypothetical protein [Spirochaetaceae bacterium]|tara:strand:+ start:113225 stop:115900 length:2676 start_codon:yes stop_codon:yes gene_type:complete
MQDSKRPYSILFLILALLPVTGVDAEPIELLPEESGSSTVYQIPAGIRTPFILEVAAKRLPEPATLECEDMTAPKTLRPDPFARITFRLTGPPPCKLILSGLKSPLKVQLWQPADHFPLSNVRSQYLGASFLILAVLSLYLLSLMIALRHPVYLYLVVFSLSFLLFELLHSGFHRELGVFPGSLDQKMLQFSGLLWPAAILLFTMEFARNKTNRPFHAILMALAGFALILSLQTVWLQLPETLLNGMQLLFAGLALTLPLSRIRITENRILVLAILILITGVVLSFLSLESSAPAAALQMMLISGILVYRIHALQKREAGARSRSEKTWAMAVSSLREAEQTRDRFLRNTAKQLQKPLSEIIDAARDYAGKGAPGSAQQIREIMEDASRLLDLFSDFSAPGAAGTVSLAQLSEDALIHARLFSASRNTQLINRISTDLFVHSNPADFRRLLNRLLDNYCILYTPTSLTLSATRKKNRIILRAQAAAGQKPSNIQNRKVSIARLVLDHIAGDSPDSECKDLKFSFNDSGFSVDLPSAPAPNPPTEVPETDKPSENLDAIFMYSEDILYGHRLKERLAQRFQCLDLDSLPVAENDELPDAFRNMRALVLDLLETPGHRLSELLSRLEQAFAEPPPVLLLSRCEELPKFLHPNRFTLVDRLIKPVSMDLIQLRLITLIAMDRRLKDQKTELAALADANQMKVRQSLHDSLGAQLTDLRLLADRLSLTDEESALEMQELKEEIDRTIAMIMDSLDEMGESQQFAGNLNEGLEANLVRRYTRAGRRVYRDFRDEPIELAPSLADELFKIVQELVTNDLKYGKGPSRWKLQKSGDVVRIEMHSASDYSNSGHSPGLGTEGIQKRIRELGGEILAQLQEGNFQARIEIPLSSDQIVRE